MTLREKPLLLAANLIILGLRSLWVVDNPKFRIKNLLKTEFMEEERLVFNKGPNLISYPNTTKKMLGIHTALAQKKTEQL